MRVSRLPLSTPDCRRVASSPAGKSNGNLSSTRNSTCQIRNCPACDMDMNSDSQVLRVMHFCFFRNPWRYIPQRKHAIPELLSPVFCPLWSESNIQVIYNFPVLVHHFFGLWMIRHFLCTTTHFMCAMIWITSAKCTFEGLAMKLAATVHAVIAQGTVVLAMCAAHPRYFRYADLIGRIASFSSSVEGCGHEVVVPPLPFYTTPACMETLLVPAPASRCRQ